MLRLLQNGSNERNVLCVVCAFRKLPFRNDCHRLPSLWRHTSLLGAFGTITVFPSVSCECFTEKPFENARLSFESQHTLKTRWHEHSPCTYAIQTHHTLWMGFCSAPGVSAGFYNPPHLIKSQTLPISFHEKFVRLVPHPKWWLKQQNSRLSLPKQRLWCRRRRPRL